MIKRILTGSVLIAVIITAIMLKWFFNILALFFIILGLYEFFTMLEKKGIRIYKGFGIVIGTAIPLLIMFGFELSQKWELLFMVLAFLLLIVLQFRRSSNSGVIVDISTTVFGIFYISWLFSFLIKIRSLGQGAGLLASVLIITKLGDIGAYFIGSRFGKIPLFPRISPAKTWEGAFGGLLFSILGALVSKPFMNLSYPHLVFIGIFIGILGQLGDLSESLMKRDCQVKDSGALLPGMGGILDEIDSVLFTAPVFYSYMIILGR